jgi:hypothetical protein
MNVAGLAAQIHNDLQDLTFALEYDEQGVHQHVPERIQGYLSTLYTKMGMLHETLKGEMPCMQN